MKALLVIGMILAHSLQLLSNPKGVFWLLSTGVNLITFSGFFFCFGYVFYLSYLSKPFADVKGKMLRTAWKTLLGYYIAAFASSVILTPQYTGKPYQISVGGLLRLAAFAEVPQYIEFLLTFFLITVVVVLLFGLFRYVAGSLPLTQTVSGVCWLTAILLPNDLRVNTQLGLFIGTDTYTVFPLVQYLPIFLFGSYFARHRIVWSRIAFLPAVCGTALLVGYYAHNREMPKEFLPSIYWLVGSYGFVYSYFLVAKWLERQTVIFYGLLSIGRNTLIYLILSNLILFSIRGSLRLEPAMAFVAGAAIILIIGFLIGLVDQPKRVSVENKVIPEPVLTGTNGV